MGWTEDLCGVFSCLPMWDYNQHHQNMYIGLRRSIRLQEKGYYDKEGKPTICYKEHIYRVFKRRRKRKDGGKTKGEISTDSFDTDCIFDYFNESSSLGSCMSSRSNVAPYTWKMTWPLASVFILSLVLPIIFLGMTAIISLLRPTDYEQTATSFPVQGPHKRCENMIMHIEKLRTELDDVKKKLNYQLPDSNIWTNFALESHGAKVHKKRSSETYEKIGGIKIFGFQLFSKVGPMTVIQGQYPPTPGNCWSFPGSHGNLFVELSHTVIISHVTLDHILSSVSPADTTTSAPHHFSVYGHQHLNDRAVHLGKFIYDLSGSPSQTFAVKVYNTITFKYIDIQVETNYGHADYTCLYGFRVHGKI